jgi:hypothetical protein
MSFFVSHFDLRWIRISFHFIISCMDNRKALSCIWPWGYREWDRRPFACFPLCSSKLSRHLHSFQCQRYPDRDDGVIVPKNSRADRPR